MIATLISVAIAGCASQKAGSEGSASTTTSSSGAASSIPGSIGSSDTSSSAFQTFASTADWDKYVQEQIPETHGWVNIPDIGQAFCHDLDRAPRVTADEFDRAVQAVMSGPTVMTRENSQELVGMSLTQFCPEYLEKWNTYLDEA